eukprot:sb/3474307/
MLSLIFGTIILEFLIFSLGCTNEPDGDNCHNKFRGSTSSSGYNIHSVSNKYKSHTSININSISTLITKLNKTKHCTEEQVSYDQYRVNCSYRYNSTVINFSLARNYLSNEHHKSQIEAPGHMTVAKMKMHDFGSFCDFQ